VHVHDSALKLMINLGVKYLLGRWTCRNSRCARAGTCLTLEVPGGCHKMI
jgi:hypothetical protein